MDESGTVAGEGAVGEPPEQDIEAGSTDRQFVVALARGLEVLACFTAGDRMLSNREIAARTGLPKSTVSRLTYTLTQLGYLRAVEEFGRYRIGAGVLGLGYAALANMRLRELARPLMQDLADYANGQVSMAVRDRLSMLYVENCRSRNTVTLRVNVGMQLPIATTSIGRAFLAALPEAERDYLLAQIRGKDPAGWEKLEGGLREALDEYREKGFCRSIGDWQKDTNAVAVPLLAPDSSEIVVFSVSGPAFVLSPRQIDEDLGPRLLYMVRTLQVAAEGAG